MAERPPSKNANAAKSQESSLTRSFMRNDFPFIRTASITLCVCMVIGAGLVSGSEYVLNKQVASRTAAQSADNPAREKLSQAENEKSEIHDFQPKYRQLMDSGFIGDEKRLNWVESIKRIQEQRNLLLINYEISPQQVFDVDPSFAAGALELHGSKMLLKMNLLHEMDLLSFLDDLKAAQAYSLRDCNIKRMRLNVQEKLSPRLYAECTLYWITLGKAAVAAGDDPQAVPAAK